MVMLVYQRVSTTPSTGFPFHGLRMQRHIQGLRMVQLRHGRPIWGRGEARAENSGARMGAAKWWLQQKTCDLPSGKLT